MIYVLLHNKTLIFSITQNFNVLIVWFGFSFILLENIFCSFGDITITTFVWRLCSAPTSLEREEGEFIVPNQLFCESLRCFFCIIQRTFSNYLPLTKRKGLILNQIQTEATLKYEIFVSG